MDSLVARLEKSEKLDDTYIIYTSDNGFHIGQHRLPPGKTCGFEEDIRVPLIIRGPGVPEGNIEQAVTTHIDFAPTIFKLAGVTPREDFDGTAIPVLFEQGDVRHEHVTVEFWGTAVIEGIYGGIGEYYRSRGDRLTPRWLPTRIHATQIDAEAFTLGPDGSASIPNNTYKAIRVLSKDYNLYYSVWCSNEHELYDLSVCEFLFKEQY